MASIVVQLTATGVKSVADSCERMCDEQCWQPQRLVRVCTRHVVALHPSNIEWINGIFSCFVLFHARPASCATRKRPIVARKTARAANQCQRNRFCEWLIYHLRGLPWTKGSNGIQTTKKWWSKRNCCWSDVVCDLSESATTNLSWGGASGRVGAKRNIRTGFGEVIS